LKRSRALALPTSPSNNANEPAIIVRALVVKLTPDFVRRLVTLLRRVPSLDAVTRANIMHVIPNDDAANVVARALDDLRAADQTLPADVAAFGIECADEAAQYAATSQNVDLVWSGPDDSAIPLRRSAAVLLDLIDRAGVELVFVSFAAFRIPDALAALQHAVSRGVRVKMILESESDSGGKYRQFGSGFADELAGRPEVELYSWPSEHRPPGGLLHAKAVIADSRDALITSANLTEHAIDTNIEIGVLIEGGPVPQKLHAHVLSLIDLGVFRIVPG
jgi:phosphatidylserine/phosphatidylglycerophosphate/cardiolipin synthase-like enzyme